MSLRRRLVIGMLILLVIGIGASDVITASVLRSFLLGRIDEQVEVTQDQAYVYVMGTYVRDVNAGDVTARTDPAKWLSQITLPTGTGTSSGVLGGATSPPLGGNSSTTPPTAGTTSTSTSTTISAPTAGTTSTSTGRAPQLSSASLARLSPDVYVEVVGQGGQVLYAKPSGSSTQPDPSPKLSNNLPVQSKPQLHRYGTAHGIYAPARPTFEIPAHGHSGHYYRGESVALAGGTLITVVPLAPTNQTLSSLIKVEVIVSLVALAVLILLALWTVQVGLRPLGEMAETAGDIAAGNLTSRVRGVDEKGEVGRLGRSLNSMLAQIEVAFTERGASEDRLRRFAADASHELRTPLTSIRGYAELLRKGAFKDEATRQRALERIEHEATRMSSLVDDLLLLARLDQGRMPRVAPVDLVRLVRAAVEDCQVATDDHQVEFLAAHQVIDPAIVVWGDEDRIAQAVDNLLRNSVIHTPSGTSVRASVIRRMSPEGLPLAAIVVNDDGPGLQDDQVSQVFNRFYQGDVARTGAGTGLGLSIVAAVAAAHGGRATVASTAGGGSVFTIELPFEYPEAPEEPSDGVGTSADDEIICNQESKLDHWQGVEDAAGPVGL